MNIAGEKDGRLAVSIGSRQYVVLDPATNRVSRPMDEREVDLSSFAPTDNSLARRRQVERQLERATLG